MVVSLRTVALAKKLGDVRAKPEYRLFRLGWRSTDHVALPWRNFGRRLEKCLFSSFALYCYRRFCVIARKPNEMRLFSDPGENPESRRRN